MLREVRGSQALAVMEKNLSLEGNTNIVLWGETESLGKKISLKERLWLYQRRKGKTTSGEKSGRVKFANF